MISKEQLNERGRKDGAGIELLYEGFHGKIFYLLALSEVEWQLPRKRSGA